MSENNISEININNYTNLNNNFYTVEWFIDTRPDYNLNNNTDSNEDPYLTDSIMNNIIQSSMEDEFIPFNSKNFKHISIDAQVCVIPISEEERNCCICYEMKEPEEISQINCGHKFCGTCIIDHISINHINPCCPLCREKINHITFQREYYQADFEDI
jgi:hypothetical protein